MKGSFSVTPCILFTVNGLLKGLLRINIIWREVVMIQCLFIHRCAGCRALRGCERRKSSTLMARSVSRESIRSNHPLPPVLLTAAPSSRIIRQSSQPEATYSGQWCNLQHHSSAASASLRQLREPSDGIAMIASESLRINGAIRQFKQVLTTLLLDV